MTDIDTLLSLFAREGYERIEPPLLQAADVFLDLSGEDIRRRMFMTQDAEGREWCLRPEYTIPVGQAHVASGAAHPASYAYAGPIFRLGGGETRQAGIESIGRTDRDATDSEILSLALEALAAFGLPDPLVRLGDAGLSSALIEQLSLSSATKRRLLRLIADGRDLNALPVPRGTGYPALTNALEGQPPDKARALIEDVLKIAGVPRVGGRSAGAITERFLDRAARSGDDFPAEIRLLLERFLAISGDPDSALSELRLLAEEASLDLTEPLDRMEARTGFMAVRGLDIGRFSFAARFARSFDYYTGMIFELSAPSHPDIPLAAGGRYDRLLSHLGAPEPLPAIGCAIWLDLLQERS